MPVIIKEDDEDDWLNPENMNFEILGVYLKPYPEEEMKFHIVSKRVNSPEEDDEKLTEEYRPEKFGYGLLD